MYLQGVRIYPSDLTIIYIGVVNGFVLNPPLHSHSQEMSLITYWINVWIKFNVNQFTLYNGFKFDREKQGLLHLDKHGFVIDSLG